MNDKPRTMTLAPHEWQALVMTSATGLYNNAQRTAGVPDAEMIGWLHDQLDRLKMQVSAWGASGAPAVPIRTEGEPVTEAWTNGSGQITSEDIATATPPKKKRGWQKGRKRGPRKPKEEGAVQ